VREEEEEEKGDEEEEEEEEERGEGGGGREGKVAAEGLTREEGEGYERGGRRAEEEEAGAQGEVEEGREGGREERGSMPVVLPSHSTRRPPRVFWPRLGACLRSGGREGGREEGREGEYIRRKGTAGTLTPSLPPSFLPPSLPAANSLEEKEAGGGEPPTKS
jgi:hypothetical protein